MKTLCAVIAEKTHSFFSAFSTLILDLEAKSGRCESDQTLFCSKSVSVARKISRQERSR